MTVVANHSFKKKIGSYYFYYIPYVIFSLSQYNVHVFQSHMYIYICLSICQCYFDDIILLYRCVINDLSMSNEFLQIFDIINNLVANIPAYTSLHISFTIFENTFLRVDFLSQMVGTL